MDKVGQAQDRLLPEERTRRLRRSAAVAFALAALALLAAVFAFSITPQTTLFLFMAFALGIIIFVLLMAWVSGQLRREQRATTNTLKTREQEFQHMADNIQEIFWVIDAETRQALYVNHAYETITGRTRESLTADPSSYGNVIHSDDRACVLSKLDEATRHGNFDEKFRIVRADGAIRWVWARGFARRESDGRITRLGGTALDITALKTAEAQVAANLSMAQSARTEAQALSKATLALTQDLRMNSVMDALLRSLAELVPYTCARVLVPDGGPHVLALGERVHRAELLAPPRQALDAGGQCVPLLLVERLLRGLRAQFEPAGQLAELGLRLGGVVAHLLGRHLGRRHALAPRAQVALEAGLLRGAAAQLAGHLLPARAVGLELCLTSDQIESELRRALFDKSSPATTR